MPLSQVPVGARVRIDSLPDASVLKERLLAMGLRPGVQLEVLRRGRPGGLLHLANGIHEFMLRKDQAAGINVSIATA